MTDSRSIVEELTYEQGVFVGGNWNESVAGTFNIEDPATGIDFTSVSNGTELEALKAVDAAAQSFDTWRLVDARSRSQVLRRCFELMLEEIDGLSKLISKENGKSITDSRAEAEYAAEFYRWYAEQAVRSEGMYGPGISGNTRTIVTRGPVGVAALVTPWNFPAAMATRKIAPALAAGCTIVLKPAAETPLTALAIGQIMAKAGVPDGVVNIVPTTDAETVVSTWLQDPRVRKLSFTGSTHVGRILLSQASQHIVNSSMELGGNAPFIVSSDADIESAVEGAMVSKFRNGGQACTASNRFYVHSSVVEQFGELFGQKIAALKIGLGTDPTTQVGPLINNAALQRISELVTSALDDGARVSHHAVMPPDLNGYFYPPTLLRDVNASSRVVIEEIFGPVAPVVTWNTDAELIKLVNATELGLAAYVYSKDLQWALRLSESFDVGMVGINRGVVSDPSTPFGGVKQSGLGREGAEAGMEAFQETQYFSIDWQ